MAIVLEKSGDKHCINLAKSDAGEIKINLSWTKGGFFKRLFGSNVDLDLGCFCELRDGTKFLIDALQFSKGRGGRRDRQTAQGCYTEPPYIWHTGDDRGSEAESSETLLLNPAGLSQIKRIVVYTFIYDSIAQWQQTKPVACISVPGCDDVIVEVAAQPSDKIFCAVASIEIGADNTFTVEKLATFHDNHAACGRAYGWDLHYTQGSK